MSETPQGNIDKIVLEVNNICNNEDILSETRDEIDDFMNDVCKGGSVDLKRFYWLNDPDTTPCTDYGASLFFLSLLHDHDRNTTFKIIDDNDCLRNNNERSNEEWEEYNNANELFKQTLYCGFKDWKEGFDDDGGFDKKLLFQLADNALKTVKNAGWGSSDIIPVVLFVGQSRVTIAGNNYRIPTSEQEQLLIKLIRADGKFMNNYAIGMSSNYRSARVMTPLNGKGAPLPPEVVRLVQNRGHTGIRVRTEKYSFTVAE